MREPVLLLLAALLLSACSLAPPEPEPIRYLHPQLAGAPAAAAGAPRASGKALRMGGVKAAVHLDDRVVWRVDAVEIGFYETRRWAEPPAALVDAALREELFERRDLAESAHGRAPHLEVRVEAFEEVLRPAHEMRLQLRVALYDESGRTRFVRTYRAGAPLAGDDARQLGARAGEVLSALRTRIATDVIAALP